MNGVIAKVRGLMVTKIGPTAITCAMTLALLIVASLTIGALGGGSGA
jgi:hypothetical protein